jgi:cephalosporin hydroxylase
MQLLAARPDLMVAIDHYGATEVPSEQDTNLVQEELDTIYLQLCNKLMHEPNVRLIRSKSTKAASIFDLHTFDYVYLDADHSYANCLKDIQCWWPKVRQGGVLAGHDFIVKDAKNGVPFGVIKAVGDFLKEKNIDSKWLHTTKEGYRSWFLFKQDGE